MTNREVITIVQKLFREVNADSKLSKKAAYSLLMKHSRWMIGRDSDKLKLSYQDTIYQTLKCIDIVEAPAIDPCCGIKSKCKVYRTKDKLPTIFEDSSGSIITGIRSIDNSKSIKLGTLLEWERKIDNPWITKLGRYVFYFNGYLYFPVHKATDVWKKVNVTALFEQDISYLDLCEECNEDKKDCILFLDRKFILPTNLEGQVLDMVKKDLIEVYAKIPEKSNEINKDDNLKTK